MCLTISNIGCGVKYSNFSIDEARSDSNKPIRAITLPEVIAGVTLRSGEMKMSN